MERLDQRLLLASDLVYWSTAGEEGIGGPDSTIRRAELDGTNVETILTNPLSGRFGGIAFDAPNGHIYSGDGSSLFRADLDGSNRINLPVPSTSTENVTDVELDLVDGRVYWSTIGANRGIYSTSLDGSAFQTVREFEPFEGTEGIALDVLQEKLYYAFGTSPFNASINVINFDGSGDTVFIASSFPNQPFDVEVDAKDRELYWNVHAGDGSIHKTALDRPGSVDLVFTPPVPSSNSFHFDAMSNQIYLATRVGDPVFGGPLDINRVSIDEARFNTLLTDNDRVNYIEVLRLDQRVLLASDFVYWSTAGEANIGGPDSTIRRAELDGSNLETILANPLSGRFGGIAFDAPNGHIYSGDGSSLFRADLDGSNRINLPVPSTSTENVTDVELDLVDGRVYWSTIGANRGIYSASLDGSAFQTVREFEPFEGTEGIALDVLQEKLYYAFGTSPFNASINVINFDGSGDTVFIASSFPNQPFDVEVDVVGHELYWNVHAGDGSIHKTALDSPGSVDLVFTPPIPSSNSFHFDAMSNQIYLATRVGDPVFGGPLDINRVNTDEARFNTLLTDTDRVNYIEVLHLPKPPAHPGDANGDGVFDSKDLVTVFQAGEYEDDIPGNSTFQEGDWNGDGDFNSSDIVFAFQTGNYADAATPIPNGLAAIEAIFKSDVEERRRKQRNLDGDFVDIALAGDDGLLQTLRR